MEERRVLSAALETTGGRMPLVLRKEMQRGDLPKCGDSGRRKRRRRQREASGNNEGRG